MVKAYGLTNYPETPLKNGLVNQAIIKQITIKHTYESTGTVITHISSSRPD